MRDDASAAANRLCNCVAPCKTETGAWPRWSIDRRPLLCRAPSRRTSRSSRSAISMAGRSSRALIDEAAREPRRGAGARIVFLGDLVDRGPDSLGAIDLAIGAGAAHRRGRRAIALMGNHEAMMRLALDPATPWDDALDALANWLRNGGTARSCGVRGFRGSPARRPEELLTVIRVALPERRRRWLETLRPTGARDRSCSSMPGSIRNVDLETFLAAPWNTPLARTRRGPALGLGALAVS